LASPRSVRPEWSRVENSQPLTRSIRSRDHRSVSAPVVPGRSRREPAAVAPVGGRRPRVEEAVHQGSGRRADNSVDDVAILHQQGRWSRPDVVLLGKRRVIVNVDFRQRVMTGTAANAVANDCDGVAARPTIVAKEYEPDVAHLILLDLRVPAPHCFSNSAWSDRMRRATCAAGAVANFFVCLQKSGTDQLFQIATNVLENSGDLPDCCGSGRGASILSDRASQKRHDGVRAFSALRRGARESGGCADSSRAVSGGGGS